jgi:NAD-dependent deacetylase
MRNSRSYQYILSGEDMMQVTYNIAAMDTESLINKAAEYIVKSKYAVALTGAGMSTESGIPDFRGPNGLWTKNPDAERIAYETYHVFQRNPSEYWQVRLTTPYLLGDIDKALPNAGHYALAELEKMGILKCVMTQNIDGLHEKAGNTRVLEYHGSIFKLRCMQCGARYHRDEYRLDELLEAGKLPPLCSACNSALKSDVVHFNEPIPQDVAGESVSEAQKCDLMLICGTSAVVYPFASLPRMARYRQYDSGLGAFFDLPSGERNQDVTIIEVNAEPTPLTSSGISDFLIQGKTAEILTRIMKVVKSLSTQV